MDNAIRPAASVILLKPSAEGFDTLLLKRSDQLSFAPSHWVFPGGKMEEFDYRDGDGEVEAALHAARRECLEEAGIDDLGELFYLATWTGPTSAKYRFRTHLFVAFVAPDTVCEVDGSEIVEGHWIPLSEAWKGASCGDYKMMPPTIMSLFDLQAHNSMDSMCAFLHDRPYFDYVPKVVRYEGGIVALYPGDSGWEQGEITAHEPFHRLRLAPDNSYHLLKTF